MSADGTVRLGVDVGGTFTDVVLVADGVVTTAKVPTTESGQSEGVLAGIETACNEAGVERAQIASFRHAMTVSTNAMLEETGAQTALVTTAGFGDVLAIGRQDRPALYDLSAERPAPLVPAERRYELDERATPDGIERTVDEHQVAAVADDIAASEAESVAVSFLHAYAHPENEQRVAEALRERLDVPVVASHETLATFREYERTATTVVDAYVTPVIDDYLGRLEQACEDRGLPAVQVMQSNGGIADTGTVRTHGVTTVLSGPAAGVVGASRFESDTYNGIITFDMGGTSSDVGLVRDGTIAETTEADVGGHPVRVPMVDVETVGAGGGSVASVDAGGALRVGPESAGAEPGPACYGKGGERPTVTDANLVLGYLGDGAKLGEDLTLDAERAWAVLDELATEAGLEDAVAAARGVYRVANARMARAIRSVTVERGHDPRAFGLVAFGGAGPMHAAALAERLGVGTVRVPRANGVLSAFGLLAADEHHDTLRTYRTALADTDPNDIDDHYGDLAAAVRADCTDPDAARIERAADLRYVGQSYELAVDVPAPFDAGTVRGRFERTHDRTRGYRLDDESVELVNLRVAATIPGTPPDISHEGTGKTQVGKRDAHFGEQALETPVYDRGALETGWTGEGPAIFEGGESTVVVPPSWDVAVDEQGTLVMEEA
jgi:N-methylhydantoinase A